MKFDDDNIDGDHLHNMSYDHPHIYGVDMKLIKMMAKFSNHAIQYYTAHGIDMSTHDYIVSAMSCNKWSGIWYISDISGKYNLARISAYKIDENLLITKYGIMFHIPCGKEDAIFLTDCIPNFIKCKMGSIAYNQIFSTDITRYSKTIQFYSPKYKVKSHF